MKKLSREEMKNVIGGKRLYTGGSCTGSVGSWEMTPPSSGNGCVADILKYCRSGNGTCNFA